MPLESQPHERLLDRHLGVAANPEYLRALDEAFEVLINEATWIFSRCWEANDGARVGQVILILFRHLIEMVDGVHILLMASATRPAQLQLRSMFEALLYIEFILAEDSDRRARAYMYGSRLFAVRYGRRMLRGSQARVQFVREVEPDPLATEEFIEGWVVEPDDLQAAEAALASETFADVQEGFTQPRRPPSWYRAVGGPINLRDLAISLNKGAQYVLIDEWSRAVHPDTIGSQLDQSGETALLRMLRDGDRVDHAALMGSRMLLAAIEMVLRHIRPEESEAFAEKAQSEIIPRFAIVSP